jgi:hypothetical protein
LFTHRRRLLRRMDRSFADFCSSGVDPTLVKAGPVDERE